MNEDILDILIEFADENWSEFMAKFKKAGFTVAEIEAAFKKRDSEK